MHKVNGLMKLLSFRLVEMFALQMNSITGEQLKWILIRNTPQINGLYGIKPVEEFVRKYIPKYFDEVVKILEMVHQYIRSEMDTIVT